MRFILPAALLAATAAYADTTPAKPKPPKGSPEEMVCRREVDTGNLVAKRKTCMTRAQWAAQSDASQAAAQELDRRGQVNSCGATTPGGC